jgi:hypothetical protein
MQWVAGIHEPVYDRLALRAVATEVDRIEINVCALEDLLAMQRAAGRPRDLEDLAHLETE